MKYFILLILLVVGCNFDANKNRIPCDGTCGVGGASDSLNGTINFINGSDDSSALCPIDFSTFQFDMTPFGGSAGVLYSNFQSLQSDLLSLTGIQWNYDQSTCLFTSTDGNAQDYTVPLSAPAILPNPTPTPIPTPTVEPTVVFIDFTHSENNSVATCPLSFNSRVFDLSSYSSGNAAEIFIDSTALEDRLEVLTGFNWIYDSLTCKFSSTDSGAANNTIPLTKKDCSPTLSLDYTVGNWQAFSLDSISSTPSVTDWRVVIQNTTILEDDQNNLTAVGTDIHTYSAGSYVGTGDIAPGTVQTLLSGSYLLKYEDDTCQYQEVVEIKPISPFIKLETAQIENSCIQKSGSVDDSGDLELFSAPLVADSNTYEQKLQYSSDSGATWLNPVSFAGGVSWAVAASPQQSGSKTISLSPAAGGMLRNCLRAVGTTAPEVCDIKQIPQPVITIDRAGGNLVFGNNTVETNSCYSQNNEEYTVTLRSYNVNGVLIEEYNAPSWVPLSSNIDLTAAPANMKAMLSVGPNGNTLIYNPGAGITASRVEAVLNVKQIYDCAGASRDTSLEWSADSYEYEFDVDSAMIGSTSLTVNSSLISPAVSNFIVHVYDNTATTPLLSWGNGTAYIAGTHYPAGPQILNPTTLALQNVDSSTYPLPPIPAGSYHLVLELSSGVKVPIGPLCVDDWDICKRAVAFEYEGWSLNGGFNYQIPIPTNMTELQSQFISLSVPDQAVVRDCAGALVYDSGMVSVTNPANVTTPLAGKDLSCGKLNVSLVSGGAADQITIYDLKLGCCGGSGSGSGSGSNCPFTLPFLDPILHIVRESTNTCSWTMQANTRYCTTTCVTRCQGFVITDDKPQSCLFDSSAVTARTVLSNACTRNTGTINNCINFSDPLERTHTVTGSVVEINFNSAAEYNKGVLFFASLDAETPALIGNELHTITLNHQRYKASACADDAPAIAGTRRIYYKKGMGVFDPLNNKITLDFTGLYPTDPSNCCIDNTLSDSDLAISWDDANIKAFYSTTQRRYDKLFTSSVSTTAGTLSNVGGKVKAENTQLGISSSTCNNNSPLTPYTLLVEDNTDFANTWKFIRGDEATGVVINAADGSGLVGSGLAAIAEYQKGTSASDCVWSISIVDEWDHPVQETDYSSVTCNLSHYGGGSKESLNDGIDLLNRLEVLTGGSLNNMQYVEHFDIIRMPANVTSGQLKNIKCN